MTEAPEPMSDAALRELLAPYALNACELHEIEQIEGYLARNPDAAAEVVKLSTAASWIGATEALTPPDGLRDTVLRAARATQRRSSTEPDDVAELYRAETDRFAAVVRTLEREDFAAMTANGLSVRDLVVHLAAMETMVSAGLGVTGPSVIDSINVEARTAAFVETFALRPIDEAVALWRESVDAIVAWSTTGAARGLLPWLGFEVQRDTLLISRAFETWIHADDIRRALGRSLEPPRPTHLHRMADFSMRNLPAWLEVAGRPHPGHAARVILTGAGGGSWLVPLAPGEQAGSKVDVVLEVDVVAWCHRIGERLTPDEVTINVVGDSTLAGDILHAASALATL